jgi:hypothetical protein
VEDEGGAERLEDIRKASEEFLMITDLSLPVYIGLVHRSYKIAGDYTPFYY